MVAQSTLALEQGERYSGHYQSARPRSNQGTARREFTVKTGPHADPKFRLGQVVKVIDHADNALKTWYLHRNFDVQNMTGEPVPGESTAPLPILSPLSLSPSAISAGHTIQESRMPTCYYFEMLLTRSNSTSLRYQRPDAYEYCGLLSSGCGHEVSWEIPGVAYIRCVF